VAPLDEESFTRGIHVRVTGRNLVRTVGGEEVATFVPDVLPPRDPPLEVAGKLGVLLTRAEQALGRLEVAGEMVPSPSP
jgi:hypothetical protein